MSKQLALHLTIALCATALSVDSLAIGPATGSLYQAPMRFTEDNGNVVALSNWKGRKVILTMAYGSCRRTCGTTVLRLGEIQRIIDSRGTNAEFVIVSYDPINDDPRAWTQYRLNRNLTRSNWHFLTGSPTDTRRIARMLGLPFWTMDSHIIHDFKILVLDPDGVVRREIGYQDLDLERLF